MESGSIKDGMVDANVAVELAHWGFSYCVARSPTAQQLALHYPRCSGIRSGTRLKTRLKISYARSTDSSMALPVGTIRRFTCRSRASQNPGNEARAEVDHPPVDFRHTGVRVEHHRPPARCWRVTSWSGFPRKTSEGKYRRSSPQRGQVTSIE